MQGFIVPPERSSAHNVQGREEQKPLPVHAQLRIKRCQKEGYSYDITRSVTLVGRPGKKRKNHIELDDRSVSRAQAKLVYDWTKGMFFINNDSRKNPIFINGQEKISIYLNDGDRIKMGEVELIFLVREGGDIRNEESPVASVHKIPDSHDGKTLILAPSKGELRVTGGKDTGRIFIVTMTETLLGRGLQENLDFLNFEDTSVSKIQAKILFDKKQNAFILINESSVNITKLNEKEVTVAQLSDGDEISFGMIKMIFTLPEQTKTLRSPQGEKKKSFPEESIPLPPPESRTTFTSLEKAKNIENPVPEVKNGAQHSLRRGRS